MSNALLVTCLCLTRDRREWLPKALDCFARQTYPHKQLLIVADKPSDWVAVLAAPLAFGAGDSIRVIETGPQCVGVKRNMGCADALGDVIAHWDDDDYSAPGRLADQVGRLESSGKAVTGYHSMKFTDGRSWWFYPGEPRGFALGTSLCYRRAWWHEHQFQEINCGQDEEFGRAAARAGQLEVAGDLDLMYATIHPGNTSPRALSAPCWHPLPGFERQEALC